MNAYRMTTRFDLDNEAERQAVTFLKGLKRGTINRFVVDAVIAHMGRSEEVPLLHDIRQIFREEMKTLPLQEVTENTFQGPDADEAQRVENDRSVLDDLENLFG